MKAKKSISLKKSKNSPSKMKVKVTKSDIKAKKSKASLMSKSESSLIKSWKEGFENDKSIPKTFRQVELGLRSALSTLQDIKDNKAKSSKLDNSKNFNDIVKFCLTHVSPALYKVFKIKTYSDTPKNLKAYAALRPVMRNYLKSVILLSRSMMDPSATGVILNKGIIPLIPFYCLNSRVGLSLVKHLANLWSTNSEEKIRVLAFVTIFRIARLSSKEMLEQIMKLLYAFYASNSRFTAPTTLETIKFMRTSLVELYCLNLQISYKLAFTYIRNMANHLRNAMLNPKLEKIQLVYNWPFVHSVHFLGDLLAKAHPNPTLQPLIYPWVQVALGTARLQRGAKYFPLVFNLAKIMTNFSHQTCVFIPVLALLLEILDYKPLRLFPKSQSDDSSEESFQWNCILKVSASQMKNCSFTDGIIEQLYGCILSYLNVECSSIGFPELVFPACTQLKKFIKSCKYPSYSKKMKHLLDKTQENSTFITNKRNDVTFKISDFKAVKDWEIATLQNDPPLLKFYENWEAVQAKKEATAAKKAEKASTTTTTRVTKTSGSFKDEENFEYEDQENEDSDENSHEFNSGPDDILGEFVPSDDDDDQDDFAQHEDHDDDDDESDTENVNGNVDHPKIKSGKESKKTNRKKNKFGKRPNKVSKFEETARPKKKQRTKMSIMKHANK